MLTQQTIYYRGPLVVDETFLCSLEKRLCEIGEQFAEQIANDSNVSAEDFNKIRLAREYDKSYENLSFKRIYDSLKTPLFDVKFKDAKFSEDLSLENILEMLDYEPGTPSYILAKVGSYSGYRVSLKIEFSWFDSCELNIKSHFKQISSTRDIIWNLLVKNSPSASIFHSPIIVKALEAFSFPLAGVLGGISLSLLSGSIRPEKWSYIPIYIFISYCLIISWKHAFPPVEFHFSTAIKSKNYQKLFIGLVSTLIIPIILSHFKF